MKLVVVVGKSTAVAVADVDLSCKEEVSLSDAETGVDNSSHTPPANQKLTALDPTLLTTEHCEVS